MGLKGVHLLCERSVNRSGWAAAEGTRPPTQESANHAYSRTSSSWFQCGASTLSSTGVFGVSRVAGQPGYPVITLGTGDRRLLQDHNRSWPLPSPAAMLCCPRHSTRHDMHATWAPTQQWASSSTKDNKTGGGGRILTTQRGKRGSCFNIPFTVNALLGFPLKLPSWMTHRGSWCHGVRRDPLRTPQSRIEEKKKSSP